jgi:acyl-coenzyme A thioesterase PaaI-like protein
VGDDESVAFQDRMVDNYCWGCGADNPAGLQLKSEWADDVAIASWTPDPAHAAGPRHLLNGGIIATLLDCHGVCTAVADACRREDREVGSDPEIWYATASIRIDYLRPTPLDATLSLVARVTEHKDRRTVVECLLEAAGKERARAQVEAVRVPSEWKHGGNRPGAV